MKIAIINLKKKHSETINKNKYISKIHQGENIQFKSSSTQNIFTEMLSSLKYAPIALMWNEVLVCTYTLLQIVVIINLSETNMESIIDTYLWFFQ